LLLSAAAALAWANSPWASSYDYVWHTPVGVRLGGFSFERSLEWYVNDALMVIFFFVVGLEIRREMHHGELSEWRRAAIPAAAALGGMLAPAGLYLAFAGEPATRSGWGVPMATDIAFAVGILTLLGKRAPAALRVLLLAVAVIDDLGAIVVIALFYSSGVSLVGLLVAALGVLGVFAMQRLGVRSKLAYIAPAFVAWAGIYAAGIHPTIAGVIVGLITPVRAWLGPEGFVAGVRPQLERLSQAAPGSLDPHELAETLRVVDAARREAMSPAESLIEKLHPFVAFGIMPIFALANAGVTVSGGALDADSWRVATAVTVGLVVGKPLGVVLAMWLALRFRLGTLPVGLTMRHLLGARRGRRCGLHHGALHRGARVHRRAPAGCRQAGCAGGERRSGCPRAGAGSSPAHARRRGRRRRDRRRSRELHRALSGRLRGAPAASEAEGRQYTNTAPLSGAALLASSPLMRREFESSR
jgi:NhaA family Na+:H+ antiporter